MHYNEEVRSGGSFVVQSVLPGVSPAQQCQQSSSSAGPLLWPCWGDVVCFTPRPRRLWLVCWKKRFCPQPAASQTMRGEGPRPTTSSYSPRGSSTRATLTLPWGQVGLLPNAQSPNYTLNGKGQLLQFALMLILVTPFSCGFACVWFCFFNILNFAHSFIWSLYTVF